MQIRTRLTLLFLLIAASILAGVLLIVYEVYKKNMVEAFFSGLKSRAEMTVKTAIQQADQLNVLPNNWIAPEGDTLPYRDNNSIYNDAFERVFSLHPESTPVSPKALQDAYEHGETRFAHYNLYAYGALITVPPGKPYVVVTEGYCDPHELFDLRKILVFSFIVGLSLIAVSGWYYAGRALAPVSDIIKQVDDLYPSDLSRRVTAGKDQDEIARLAETFNRMLDRAEQAFRMQRMFLSNVSHELKNPITAIKTQLEVVLQQERDPDKYRNVLQSVLEDILMINAIEENLLQLARIYNDPQAIKMSAARIDEILWQARSTVQRRNSEYKILIDLKNLPETEDSLFVAANEALLCNAFINLMDNACKYGSNKTAYITVHLMPDHAHLVEVADNGPGIPLEEQALIFEPFFRSPRHLQIKGTGIGLSLVQSILQLHRISLTINSPESGGTVFGLQFPKQAAIANI